MLKYIILVIFFPNWILAETWLCEISLSNNGRGNINEQKIYTKHHNYYLKLSQFGDKKLNVLMESGEFILLLGTNSDPSALFVFLNKNEQTFYETVLDMNNNDVINPVTGKCLIN